MLPEVSITKSQKHNLKKNHQHSFEIQTFAALFRLSS